MAITIDAANKKTTGKIVASKALPTIVNSSVDVEGFTDSKKSVPLPVSIIQDIETSVTSAKILTLDTDQDSLTVGKVSGVSSLEFNILDNWRLLEVDLSDSEWIIDVQLKDKRFI